MNRFATSNNPVIQLCMTIVAVKCQIQLDLPIFIKSYIELSMSDTPGSNSFYRMLHNIM